MFSVYPMCTFDADFLAKYRATGAARKGPATLPDRGEITVEMGLLLTGETVDIEGATY